MSDTELESLEGNDSINNKFERYFPKLDAWDKTTIKTIYKRYADSKIRKIAIIISFLGDPRLWGIVLTILGIYGLIVQDLSLAVIFGTGIVQSYVIYFVIKRWFKRDRPFIVFDDVKRLDKTGHGYSFPSGHAHHSTLLIGLLWFSLFPYPWALILLLVYNVCVSYSRLISGCHYPSDTITGVLLGYLQVCFHWFVTKGLYLMIYQVVFNFIW